MKNQLSLVSARFASLMLQDVILDEGSAKVWIKNYSVKIYFEGNVVDFNLRECVIYLKNGFLNFYFFSNNFQFFIPVISVNQQFNKSFSSYISSLSSYAQRILQTNYLTHD